MNTTTEVNTQAVTTQEGVWVSIDQIVVPEDARPHTQEDIDSRAVSMSREGQAQAALLSKEGDKLMLVYGHGRLLSAKKLGWEKLRCDIKEGLSETQKLMLALVENAERENESPFHTAGVYQKLMDAEQLTHDQLATRLGKAKVLVDKYSMLSGVPKEVRQSCNALQLSLRQCLEIAKLTNVEHQLKVMEECATQDLSGKALESRVKQLQNPGKGEAPAKPVDGRQFRFSWKEGRLLIKAVFVPEEGKNFMDFTCDMDHAYDAFVDLHPMPAAKSDHTEEATVQQAA